MTNVFKKLISEEFGINNYYRYFFSYQQLLYDREYNTEEIENDEVYKDIYNTLKKMDIKTLISKQAKLSETMLTAFSISRSYLMILATYLTALWILLSQGFESSILEVSVTTVSLAFAYKTYVYLINKFCYVDAHIIIIYKSVLDKLLNGNQK